MFPKPNLILAGKYRLSRQLGQGGMGSVWLAEHLTLHSPVAIKLIEPSIAANADALTRFMREAQAAAALRSPHVVQILDHGVDAGVPFIVMEALEGESLADRLSRLGRLPPTEIGKLMTHIGRAMTRAHEAGVVHRDLKPENVFIVRNDEEELAKVLDFGVAKSSQHGVTGSVSSATRTGAVLGTPYYMSPEQAEGARLVDRRTDIWAMGVIAYECLLGGRPFQAETLGGLLLAICAREMPVPSRAGPVIPGFDQWFARACARDLVQRFATAREAAGDLRLLCEQSASAPRAATSLDMSAAAVRAGVATPAPSPEFARTTASVVSPPRASQPLAASTPRRRSAWAWVAGASVLVVAVAIGGWALNHGSASPPAPVSELPHPQEAVAKVASAPAVPPASTPSASSAPDASVATVAASASAALSGSVAKSTPPRHEAGTQAPNPPSQRPPAAPQPGPPAAAPRAQVNLGI
jgi:eukaryotic-like serine/threonine-protein kinase